MAAGVLMPAELYHQGGMIIFGFQPVWVWATLSYIQTRILQSFHPGKLFGAGDMTIFGCRFGCHILNIGYIEVYVDQTLGTENDCLVDSDAPPG